MSIVKLFNCRLNCTSLLMREPKYVNRTLDYNKKSLNAEKTTLISLLETYVLIVWSNPKLHRRVSWVSEGKCNTSVQTDMCGTVKVVPPYEQGNVSNGTSFLLGQEGPRYICSYS